MKTTTMAGVPVAEKRRDDEERPYRNLGNRIAKARPKWMTQRDLAQRVGINHGYVSVIETGRRNPGKGVLQRIARVLDLDYDELAALAGYMSPPSGDVRVLGSGEKASALRRMLRYSVRNLHRAEIALAAFASDESEQSVEEEGEEEGEDGPESGGDDHQEGNPSP